MSDLPLSLEEQVQSLHVSIDAACEKMDELRAERNTLTLRIRSILESVGRLRTCSGCGSTSTYWLLLRDGNIEPFDVDGQMHVCKPVTKGNA